MPDGFMKLFGRRSERPIPDYKSCVILKSRRFVFVGDERIKSNYVGGYSAAPNFLELTPAPEALGLAIAAALAASHAEANPYSSESKKLERTERWKAHDDWCAEAVREFGFKDRRDLFKPVRKVSVVQKGPTITLTPSRQYARDGWDADPFSIQRKQSAPADSDAVIIGESAQAALAACGSRFGG